MRSKKRNQPQLLLLVALIALQLGILWGLKTYRPQVKKAYLIKNGPEFVVFWQEDNRIWQRSFVSLSTALEFSKVDLKLGSANRPAAAANMERIWVQPRAGQYSLLWKTMTTPYLHKWSFQSPKEVKTLATLFRNGGYTKSPYGHALLLLPLSSN